MGKKIVILLALSMLAIMPRAYPQEMSEARERAEKPVSQTPYIKGRLNLGVSCMKIGLKSRHGFRFSAEVLYGVNNWLEVGVFEHCYLKKGRYSDNEEALFYSLPFGAEAKAHLLPAVINKSFSIVDLYANFMMGANIVYLGEGAEFNGQTTAYKSFLIGGGAGIAVNPTRYFGFFFEYNYIRTQRNTIRFGINIRFPQFKKDRKT